jgi:probable rRNA maturation factor
MLKKYINEILYILFKKTNNLEISFVFVNNKYISQLNKKFLNKNEPTDVLCFKYDKYSADIIISLDQVIKNSKVFKTSPKWELLFVLIHGLLHFKGMDDDTEDKRKMMYNAANKILKNFKV